MFQNPSSRIRLPLSTSSSSVFLVQSEQSWTFAMLPSPFPTDSPTTARRPGSRKININEAIVRTTAVELIAGPAATPPARPPAAAHPFTDSSSSLPCLSASIGRKARRRFLILVPIFQTNHPQPSGIVVRNDDNESVRLIAANTGEPRNGVTHRAHRGQHASAWPAASASALLSAACKLIACRRTAVRESSRLQMPRPRTRNKDAKANRQLHCGHSLAVNRPNTRCAMQHARL
ncbi:hypothetical protein CKAH01_07251 [Colletotrichum kahawae]|uniref:Uncharacterized protein n=1 Tax=Colletotrichum kahawae TaxID=34407 RepID=A0AAD9Y6C7_COLKA|nr:hypothetical protein CKAH01_07251 [Colletotrichum kahawae]